MIIYHAQPCREYPILCDQLGRHNTAYQFHEPFEIIDKSKYIKKEGILNYHPSQTIPEYYYFPYPSSITFKGGICNPIANGLSPIGKFTTSYKIKLVYGVFSINRIITPREHFIFTFIDNPVDYIYNSFFYCNFISNDNHSSLLKKATNSMFNISLESFIDNYIKNGVPDFTFQGDRYKLIQELFKSPNLDIYNFIIFRESPEIGFNRLNKITNLKLSCPRINASIIKNNTYRRADLEELLKDDIIKYNEMKEKFLK